MVDSLEIFEVLKSASIPESQARAMTLAIQKAESDVSSDLTTVTARLEERMGGLEERMDRFEERMDRFEERMDRFEERLGGLRVEMHGIKTDIIRWNFAFWVAQLTAMAAILKLLR